MLLRFAAAVLGCLLLAAPASAQESQCFPWEPALIVAYKEFGQLPAALAVSDGGVIIVTVNPKTKAWTMFIQPNETTACIIGAGEYWDVPSKGVIDNIIAKATPGKDT